MITDEGDLPVSLPGGGRQKSDFMEGSPGKTGPTMQTMFPRQQEVAG